MLTPTTHRFLDANALADELAAHVSQCLLDTLQYQTHATLAVSGGRSPIAFFRNLSERALPWHAIAVTLVDDRCVPNTHDDSNALLVRTHLLRDQAARARFLPPIDWSGDGIAPTPEALADQATHALSALGGADVVVLGMGADGHTPPRCSRKPPNYCVAWICRRRRVTWPCHRRRHHTNASASTWRPYLARHTSVSPLAAAQKNTRSTSRPRP